MEPKQEPSTVAVERHPPSGTGARRRRRPSGEPPPLPRELGNKFALVMLPLPTSRLAPLQRLTEAEEELWPLGIGRWPEVERGEGECAV